MNRATKQKLRTAGFAVGDAREFLGLSSEDAALIELKVQLVEMLRRARRASGLTQRQLARLIRSSQSRVAKLEAGGADASLDLICKALFALGVSRQRIGRGIAGRRAA